MQLKGRAFYNLLQLGDIRGGPLAVQPWQVEELRSLPEQTLFQRLEAIDASLSRERFVEQANLVASPEELANRLWTGGRDSQQQEVLYLVLFELWRRLLPERQALSVFCDELDFEIAKRDRGDPDEETLRRMLGELEGILDDSAAQGQTPHEVLRAVSDFCAHDLESVLYDYIAEQIDRGNWVDASELIDGFAAYVEDAQWFELLRARILGEMDPEGADALCESLLEQLQTQPDLGLLLEVVDVLAKRANAGLFFRSVSQALSLPVTKEELRELMRLTAAYFQGVGKLQEREAICAMLQRGVLQVADHRALQRLLEDAERDEV